MHSKDRLTAPPSKEGCPLAHKPAENWDQPKAMLSVPVSQAERGLSYETYSLDANDFPDPTPIV